MVKFIRSTIFSYQRDCFLLLMQALGLYHHHCLYASAGNFGKQNKNLNVWNRDSKYSFKLVYMKGNELFLCRNMSFTVKILYRRYTFVYL